MEIKQQPFYNRMIGFFMLVIAISSCQKMNDIQNRFTKDVEKVYLGRVDSVKVYPGFKKVKLTWYQNADPRIDQTVIYWNSRQDSVVTDFNRTHSGYEKDSIIIDTTMGDLPIGTSLFEFRNISKRGFASLFVSAEVTIWGNDFANSLHARRIVSIEPEYPDPGYRINLSSLPIGDSTLLFSEITYLNATGQKEVLKIANDTNQIVMNDLLNGEDIRFRTAFFPSQGIDTIYNSLKSFKSPKVAVNRGNQVHFMGDLGSDYFTEGDSIYEWNAQGDFVVYELTNNEINPVDTLVSIAPRSIYKEIINYRGDLFIGVTNANEIFIFRIQDRQIDVIKNPSGESFIDDDFVYSKIVDGNKFFYTVSSSSGNLKKWYIGDDAQWGSAKGTKVADDFQEYKKLIMVNSETLLGVDENGNLWRIPVMVDGSVSDEVYRVGSGWGQFKKIIVIGDNLLCVDNNKARLLNDFDPVEKFWAFE